MPEYDLRAHARSCTTTSPTEETPHPEQGGQLKRVIVALTLVINLVACASPRNGLLRTATPASAGSGPVYGTKGDDILHAGAEDDDIWGGGGNDIIYGGSGNDSIHSGIGKDSIFGGGGSVDVCYVSYRDPTGPA